MQKSNFWVSRLILIIGLFLAEKVFAQNFSSDFSSSIPIQKIEIIGNTVFSDTELKTLIEPTIKEKITLKEILQIQELINNFYIEKGYISSGSLLPSQELNGQIQIEIIEGKLSDIQIKQLSSLRESYIKSRLPPTGKPFNVNQLIQALVKLETDPLIKKIDAEIIQESLGKNILLLEIKENSPWSAQLNFNNAYSPSIGRFGGNVSITHQNLLGFGDRLNLNRSQTEGLTRLGGYYSFPFNQADGRVTLSYNNADSNLVEEETEDLGIEADFASFRTDIQQPIISTRDEILTLGVGIELINSETFVLEDLSFSFTEGLPDGRSQITALRFFQEYVKNGTSSLLAINSQFNVGLDLFDATITDLGIDSIFWSWQGDIQYLNALNQTRDALFTTRLIMQLTPDRLLPIEQFTLGGLGQVRGYRSNLGVADNGIIGTIELQLPLFKQGTWGEVKILPFFDVGTIWNNNRETVGSNTFASTGIALRYRYQETIEARVDYGIPLIEPTGLGATDTEDRLIFSILLKPLRF